MLWVIAAAILGSVVYLVLSRDPLAQYDYPKGDYFDADGDSKALRDITATIGSDIGETRKLPLKEQLVHMRQSLDCFFDDIEKTAVFQPISESHVKGEWVIAPGVDQSRRLLYIHGGAFYVGSPKSHRVITSRLSEIANCAVLAVDYRLMPENKRVEGIEDCRNAYDWMLQHSVDGIDNQPTAVFIAGDSAGGNLTLSLLSWIRDTQRPQVNAAVALSPVTDMQMLNPSIRVNNKHDVILGPLFKLLTKVPRVFFSTGYYFLTGQRTKAPLVSPLHGDLSDLPPILVQISEHEILRDDGRRYVNKAVAAGTDATLQVWPHMPHVWHIFYPRLPESDKAFEQIKLFIDRHS